MSQFMLKREIGRWDLVLLLINSTIGAGIFGLPSQIYKLSGNYSIPALILCALIVFILVLNFAEVASRFRKTGGPYLYILEAFGKIPAFIIGWLILITRVSTYAALISLMITYLGYFNPVVQETFVRNVVIIAVTSVLTWVNYLGIRNSTNLTNILSIAKILPLLIFVLVGLFFINPDLINTSGAPPVLSDFTSSVLILIFAFTGFEAVLVNTGEIRDPKRNIPFALILSLSFVAVFYCLIQFVSIGTLPGLEASDKPITEAAGLFMGTWGAILITLGAVISIGGTLNAVMLVGSRLPFALSAEKQFPELFSFIHPRHHTPVYSLLIFSAVSIIASVSGSFIYAVSISVISKVLIFLLVCIAMLKLRRKPLPQGTFFKLRYGRISAFFGIIASLGLLLSSKLTDFMDVIFAVTTGLICYSIFKIYQKARS